MPLPKSKKDESHDDFMNRCMGDDVMVSEYPDEKQRYAVCESQWDNKKSDTGGKESRVMDLEDVELRIQENGHTMLVGYAAKFGKWSVDLGGFREKIREGAFDDVLEDDVRALKNHDSNLVLGRTTSGTLRLKTNKTGLRFEIDMPDTTTGRDTLEEVRRKDITGCSFAFRIAEEEWHETKQSGEITRTIIKIDRLFDVGPVTYPAYPDTTVAARSLDAYKEHLQRQADEIKKVEAAEAAKQLTDREAFERRHRIDCLYRKAGRLLMRNRPAKDR